MAGNARNRNVQLKTNKNGIKVTNKLNSRNKYVENGYFKKVTKLKICLITIIVSCCGIGYLKKDYFFPEKVYKLGDIIKLHIKVANQIIDHELQLRSFLHEDPTFEIVKNGLRPIQERISSLRVQTSQYEKMEQIPGGPSHFIDTSIKELDHIMNTQLIKLANEALASIAEKAKSIGLLSKSSSKLVKENHQTTDPIVIRAMVMDDLVITPLDEEKEEIDRLADSNFTTIEDAMEKLEHLAELYGSLTDAVETTVGKLGFSQILEMTDTELTVEDYDNILPMLENVFKIRELIAEEKRKYMKHYKVFWVLKSKILKNTFVIMERLKNYEQEKRAPFIDLQTMIIKDVTNLKVRIKNLQYKYAKKNINKL